MSGPDVSFPQPRNPPVTPASSEDDAVDSETPGSGVDGSRTDEKGPPAATGEESG
jgi:hypothetical protein